MKFLVRRQYQNLPFLGLIAKNWGKDYFSKKVAKKNESEYRRKVKHQIWKNITQVHPQNTKLFRKSIHDANQRIRVPQKVPNY